MASGRFFQFEADFVESLRCIPMQVRLKLDTCGIKLKLPTWHSLTLEERTQLAELACDTPEEVSHYRDYLQQRVVQHTGELAATLPIDEHPAWLNSEVVPESVMAKAQALGHTIAVEQWGCLQPVERFALVKLSRSSHENKNFEPALQEFGLIC
jgi:hypothetical protein